MQKHIFNIDTVLLTQRAVVRRFRESDGESLYELFQNNHSRLSDHFQDTLLLVKEKADTEFFVRQKLARWLLQEEYCFGIWENENAQLIGYVSLFNIDWYIPEARLTFFIDKEHSKRGLMTEVLLHITRFAFEQLQLERIYMRTAQDNYPAQRLARKCGYRREGDLRNAYRKQSGELLDLMLIALTRAEYEKA